MSDVNQTQNYLAQPPEKPKLPTFLNVLTILTFIWCVYECYSSLSNFLKGRKAIEQLEEAQSKLENAPDWAKKMAGPDMIEIAKKGFENRVPILIIGLLGTALCVYGAIEMRKLKKQGYMFWLIGEVLPWIAALIFIGPILFKTFIGFFLFFPILFIILYTTQRKHLVY